MGCCSASSRAYAHRSRALSAIVIAFKPKKPYRAYSKPRSAPSIPKHQLSTTPARRPQQPSPDRQQTALQLSLIHSSAQSPMHSFLDSYNESEVKHTLFSTIGFESFPYASSAANLVNSPKPVMGKYSLSPSFSNSCFSAFLTVGRT